MRGWVPALATALAVAIGAGVAVGDDHRPPRAELRGGGESRNLHPWSLTWARPSGENGCVITNADGFPSYRPRLLLDHLHSKPRVFFRKRQRPRGVRLREYRRLGDDGAPRGSGRRVDVDLLKRSRGGETKGWAVRFRATVPDRRFYELSARWRDRQGCGGAQSLATSFRLVRD